MLKINIFTGLAIFAIVTGCANPILTEVSDFSLQHELDAFRTGSCCRFPERRNAAIQEAFRRGYIRQENVEAIVNRAFRIGFNKWEVVAAWGFPGDINRTASVKGIREQWVYGEYSRVYVYFNTKGLVTSWQD